MLPATRQTVVVVVAAAAAAGSLFVLYWTLNTTEKYNNNKSIVSIVYGPTMVFACTYANILWSWIVSFDKKIPNSLPFLKRMMLWLERTKPFAQLLIVCWFFFAKPMNALFHLVSNKNCCLHGIGQRDLIHLVCLLLTSNETFSHFKNQF